MLLTSLSQSFNQPASSQHSARFGAYTESVLKTPPEETIHSYKADAKRLRKFAINMIAEANNRLDTLYDYYPNRTNALMEESKAKRSQRELDALERARQDPFNPFRPSERRITRKIASLYFHHDNAANSHYVADHQGETATTQLIRMEDDAIRQKHEGASFLKEARKRLNAAEATKRKLEAEQAALLRSQKHKAANMWWKWTDYKGENRASAWAAQATTGNLPPPSTLSLPETIWGFSKPSRRPSSERKTSRFHHQTKSTTPQREPSKPAPYKLRILDTKRNGLEIVCDTGQYNFQSGTLRYSEDRQGNVIVNGYDRDTQQNARTSLLDYYNQRSIKASTLRRAGHAVKRYR